MGRQRAALGAPLFAIAVALLMGCSGSTSLGVGDNIPECSVGHGADGSVATLRLRADGPDITGTYDVVEPGTDVGIRYQVEGTAEAGKLTSRWVFGGAVVNVTGKYTAKAIDLDNPDGKFGIVHFAAGC